MKFIMWQMFSQIILDQYNSITNNILAPKIRSFFQWQFMRWLWIFSRPNMHMCLIIMMRENEDPIILDHLTIGAWELREHRLAKADERRVDAYSHISFRWHCKFFVIQVFFSCKNTALFVPIYIGSRHTIVTKKPHSQTACTPAGYFF